MPSLVDGTFFVFRFVSFDEFCTMFDGSYTNHNKQKLNAMGKKLQRNMKNKVIGGVYDERFLIKPVPAALRLLAERGLTPQWELPYPGAKEMLAPDVDERELLCSLVRTVADALPAPREKKSGKAGL